MEQTCTHLRIDIVRAGNYYHHLIMMATNLTDKQHDTTVQPLAAY